MQRQSNLGYFDAFMRAWGTTSEPVHAEIYAETLQYNAGTVAAYVYVRDVSRDLGIAAPGA